MCFRCSNGLCPDCMGLGETTDINGVVIMCFVCSK
jgi:hypothetical protein